MVASIRRKGVFALLNSVFFVTLSLVGGKVDNSFQNSQYPQFYGSTPGYQYPDLTVKNTGDVSSGQPIGEVQQPELLSQSSATQPVVHGVPNQHMYYYETYPMQDSSRGNTYSVPGPGSHKRCTYMANGNVKCYSRQDYGYANNDYDTTGDDGGGGAGASGLLGLLGLLGLKGLKTVIGPLLLLPILLPFLLLLAIPLLLFLPIPVISIPTAGRSLQWDLTEARRMATGVYERVISSDECVERIACEISRMSRKRKAGDWVEKALNYLPENSPITKRIFKGFDTLNNNTVMTATDSRSGLSCAALKCKMLNLFDSRKG